MYFDLLSSAELVSIKLQVQKTDEELLPIQKKINNSPFAHPAQM